MKTFKTPQSGHSFISILMAFSVISLLLMISVYTFKSSTETDFKVQQQAIHMVQMALSEAKLQALYAGEPLRLTPVVHQARQGLALMTENPPKRVLKRWLFQTPELSLQWHGFHQKPYMRIHGHPSHILMSGHFLILKRHRVIAKLSVSRFGDFRVINIEQHGMIMQP